MWLQRAKEVETCSFVSDTTSQAPLSDTITGPTSPVVALSPVPWLAHFLVCSFRYI